jgi:hypothetical protein
MREPDRQDCLSSTMLAEQVISSNRRSSRSFAEEDTGASASREAAPPATEENALAGEEKPLTCEGKSLAIEEKKVPTEEKKVPNEPFFLNSTR